MQKTTTSIIIGVLIILGALLLFWPKPGVVPTPTQTASPVACTTEAKLCPDGSYVGRVGPNCEFAQCPNISTPTPTVGVTSDVTLAIGQTGDAGGVMITLNSITQDSRCPSDVECIQAGMVQANIRLVSGIYAETKILSSTEAPYAFRNYLVSISSVLPAKESKVQILPSQYRITFHVVPGPKVSALGERCGGNMQNPPVCATGLHCAPEPGSHLPFGDVGGICVKN
ncbi:MAG: hypothetical protein PHV42_02615 [Candidatus Pacebacteria bacterium]|nr:hypothetical protein [Candidatus Paceibacterota bacterium]